MKPRHKVQAAARLEPVKRGEHLAVVRRQRRQHLFPATMREQRRRDVKTGGAGQGVVAAVLRSRRRRTRGGRDALVGHAEEGDSALGVGAQLCLANEGGRVALRLEPRRRKVAVARKLAVVNADGVCVCVWEGGLSAGDWV